MVHRTPTRDKNKQLLVEAQQLDQAIANLPLLCDKTDIELKIIQKQIEKDKSRILAEATSIEARGQTRRHQRLQSEETSKKE